MTLIFDLDGTLLDTLEDLHRSVNHALSSNAFPTLSPEDVRKALGWGAHELIRRCLPDGVSEERLEATFATFHEHYKLHSSDHTAPYNGIINMLKECRRRGYATAIVSNKPDYAVQTLYQRFFSEVIDIAVGAQSGMPIKPAPDMVLYAQERLGGNSAAIYIGDSEIDIATAEAAQMPCIAVSWGFRGRHSLEENKAQHIIDSPSEFFKMVEKIDL